MSISGRTMNPLAIAAVCLLLPGCAVSLFNQSRLDRAKEAQATFVEVKLAESLVEERAQNAEILAREIRVDERASIAVRDGNLQRVIEMSPKDGHKALKTIVGDQLRALGGENSGALQAAVVGINELTKQRDRFAGHYALVKATDDPMPRCTAESVTVDPAARRAWNEYQDRCRQIDRLQQDLARMPSTGEAGRILSSIAAIAASKARTAEDLRAATAEYDAAKNRLIAERARGKTANLAETAAALKKRIDAINTPEGHLQWLAMQQKHVATLLEAAARAETEVPAGVDDDLQIATALPALAVQLQAGLKFPRTSALILQAEHLRLEADRRRREIARDDEESAILHRQRDLLFQEADSLRLAEAELDACKDSDLAAATTVAALPQPCGNAITAALIHYANAWTTGRVKRRTLDYARLNLRQLRSLDATDVALAEWQNLIAAPLAALVTSHETGIKADEIGRTLNAAGLGWIGLGVH